MSRPITPAAWKRAYEQKLQELDLVTWTLEMDDGQMLEGQEPPKGDAEWKKWFVNYNKVRISLEGGLGDWGEAIEHPSYAQLPNLAPIKLRIETLHDILVQAQQVSLSHHPYPQGIS